MTEKTFADMTASEIEGFVEAMFGHAQAEAAEYGVAAIDGSAYSVRNAIRQGVRGEWRKAKAAQGAR